MASNETERRTTTSPVECRSTAAKPRAIAGYASVFNARSQPLGQQGIIERVSPRFFNKSKGDGWPGVTARYDHKSEFILGSTRAGTLDLKVDGTGLFYTVDLPESRSDIYELIDRGDVAGSSFSFNVFDDDWDFDGGQAQRTLLSGKLLDIGPTSTPAYLDSSAVALRSLAANRNADFEDVKTLAAQGELRRLWTRTDISPAVTEPVLVETRSEPRQPTPHQRIVELHRMRMGWDQPTGPTPQQRLVELHRMKIDWDNEYTQGD